MSKLSIPAWKFVMLIGDVMLFNERDHVLYVYLYTQTVFMDFTHTIDQQ